MDFLPVLEEQPDAAVNQDSAKDEDDPVEPLQQCDPRRDKNSPHDERAHHAPEQHLMLKLAGHAEVAEDKQEDEEIIDAQR